MIRKLRAKFVAISMALVTVVLAAVFFSVHFAVRRNIEDITHQLLLQVVQEDALTAGGVIRPDIGVNIGGSRVLLPYFTVSVWGKSAYVTGGTYANLEDTETLQTILNECLEQAPSEGIVEGYHLRYLRQENGIYQKIAFVDMSMEQAMLRDMLLPYLKIALAAFLLLLGASILLSHWATAPVERAWKQQRQFLSDASHELKTPLTVILSNAELLEHASLSERPARWADNIHAEARRMRTLVEEMLTLARSDHGEPSAVFAEVSLSDLVSDCALSFEPVAFEAGKPLQDQIAPDVVVLGDGDRLRQLAAALLDNAIKYGGERQSITLTLEKTDRLARLTVTNTGTPIPPEQLSHLFERFYRSDASRGEQSGFGLGLSIAAAIARQHKGTLRAESDDTSTRFFFSMPLKKP